MNFKHRQLHGILLQCRYYASKTQKTVLNEVDVKKWESVVGLEVHAQIAAETKLFSGSSTQYGAPANTQVSYFDAGLPGTLPVLNRRCVEAGVKTALALGCRINKKSNFDRKHYFYADLPVGYQITQQLLPLAVDGKLSATVVNFNDLKSSYNIETKIKQLQLEQDSGKSLHDVEDGYSLIDLNRAGFPLMEIVFEPDLKTGEEAAAVIRELQLILLKLATCNCRMEEGSLRVDANVSVNKAGKPMGTRTEVKNLNSLNALAKAIDYEIKRQIEILEKGGTVENETMSFDTKLKQTISMRDKEKVQDYRFMPEPNLPPLLLRDNRDMIDGEDRRVCVDDLKKLLPDLPFEIRERLKKEHGLSIDAAARFVNSEPLFNYFTAMVKHKNFTAKQVSNFLFNELLTSLGKLDKVIEDCAVPSDKFIEALELRLFGAISLATLQEILMLLVNGDVKTPKQIVDENDWSMITDRHQLEALCKQVIELNSSKAKSYKSSGKSKIFSDFVTEVKKISNNRADMPTVITVMKELLDKKK